MALGGGEGYRICNLWWWSDCGLNRNEACQAASCHTFIVWRLQYVCAWGLPMLQKWPPGQPCMFLCAGHGRHCPRGHRSPGQASSFSFGSPPVLAHKDGGGGDRVLEVGGWRREAGLRFGSIVLGQGLVTV